MYLKAALERPHAIFRARVGRQGCHGNVSPRFHRRLAQLGKQLKTVHARHAKVTHDRVRCALVQRAQRRATRICTDDRGTSRLEDFTHQRQRIRIVVDDQNLKPREIDRCRRLLAWLCTPTLVVDVETCAGRGRSRQPHRKSGALSRAVAFGPDRASMQLDQLARDRQAEAQPAILPRETTVGLPKTLEDMRQELRRNAGAAIADHDLEVRVDAMQSHLHQAVTGREADGIRDQIPDHLLKTIGIPQNRSGRRVHHASAAARLSLPPPAGSSRSPPR